MGEFDGVGRIYRTELNPHPERHPQVDRTDRDRHGKGDSDHQGEEPEDKIELHEEAVAPVEPPEPSSKSKPKDRKLDISA